MDYGELQSLEWVCYNHCVQEDRDRRLPGRCRVFLMVQWMRTSLTFHCKLRMIESLFITILLCQGLGGAVGWEFTLWMACAAPGGRSPVAVHK